MRLKISIIINIIIISIASCSTIEYKADSTTPLNDRAYAELAMTSGTNSKWSLFGLWMFGRPDIDNAIQNALAKNGGDALINVTSHQERMWFLLFSIDTLTIEGKAIKFYTEEKVAPDDIKTE